MRDGRMRAGMLALAGAAAVASCGSGGDGGETQAPETASNPRPAAFAVCASCHTTGPGRGPAIGPNLFGVVGSKAGSRPGYNYSEALKGSAIVWSEETIARFIVDPQAMVPGTKMTIRGPRDPEQQKAITAYLASLK